MCRVHSRDDVEDVFFDVAMWLYAGMDMSDITDLLSSRRETPNEYEVDLDETTDLLTEQIERLISLDETYENYCGDLIDALENRAEEVVQEIRRNELNLMRTECYEFNDDYPTPDDYAYLSLTKFELISDTRSGFSTQTDYGFMSGIDFQVMNFLTEFRNQSVESDNTLNSMDKCELMKHGIDVNVTK